MPKYLQISLYVSLVRAAKDFNRTLMRVNSKECLTEAFVGHALIFKPLELF